MKNIVRMGILLVFFAVSEILFAGIRPDAVGQGLAMDVSNNVRAIQETHRALLVGINVYDPAYGQSPLPSCVNDAMGVRNTILLSDPGQRWTASSIQVLTNSFATRAAIRSSLQLLATDSQPGDLVLYAHSSHGGQYSGTSVFLCAYDQDYSAVNLGQDLTLFNAGVTVIVLVDACHSGGLFKQKDGWPFAEMTMQAYRAAKTKQYQSKGQAVPKDLGNNIAFMTACDYSQTCLAGDPYSLYIGTVITGCLDSAVDANKDGLYQFSELHAHAAQLASQVNSNQTAQQFHEAVLTSMVARSVGSIKREGDFDGDGKADPYVVDTDGNWYFFYSLGGYQSSGAVPVGRAGWQAVAADFDGDGKADPAMVDAAGNWYFWYSLGGYACQGPYDQFGHAVGCQAVAADFDGDGKADPAMVDADSNWYFCYSLGGYACQGPYDQFGHAAGCQAVAGDFDDDGKADPAMVDAAGNWYICYSLGGYARQGPYPFGPAGWWAVAADFDADGKADPAMVANNYWIVRFSGEGFAPSDPFLLSP